MAVPAAQDRRAARSACSASRSRTPSGSWRRSSGGLLEALVDQVAVAIERTNLAADIEEARLLTETEHLRSALLSSVSHDLRTPLVSIIGSATRLASCDGALSSGDRAQLVQTILEESERLNRFVQNLLDMTRLGYGALQPNREWVDLREIVGRALKQMARALASLKSTCRSRTMCRCSTSTRS